MTSTYYFNDHLGAPILQTDATGAVVWHVERDPYGERYATRVGGERHQPLGLPGQEYDASSDRQYNIFRWYRPSWGRYTQPDPVDVETAFTYVEARPITRKDALGLYSVANFPDDEAQDLNRAIKRVWDLLRSDPCCLRPFWPLRDVMMTALANPTLTFQYDASLPLGVCAKVNPFSLSAVVRVAPSAFSPRCGCLADTVFHEISHFAFTTDLASNWGPFTSAYDVTEKCNLCQ